MTNIQVKMPTLNRHSIYKTDSGLGGVFKLKFLLQDEIDVYHFQNISLGFESWQHKVKPGEINDFLIQ